MPYRYQETEEYNWLMEQVLYHETTQAMALGKLLYEKLSPKSVIDVGGGPGIYLVPFKERGCEVYCIDGAPKGGESLSASEFELVDLRNPWTPDKQYDLSLCIEVAEHLQPYHADVLVETIAKCAPMCFFTAARPGQGGEGHWNEQTKEYWLEKFSKFGMSLHPRNVEIMSATEGDPAYDHCHWIRWNGMLIGR